LSPSRARAAVFLVFFVHGAVFASWVARIPAVKGELGLSDAGLGLVLLCGTFGGVLALPAAGWVVARTGSRTTVELGQPAYALLLVTLALAPTPVALAAGFFLFGAAASAIDVAMNAHGIAVERLLERPILSSFHAGWSLGGLAGAGAGAGAAGLGIGPGWHFAGAALALGATGVAASRRLLPASADRGEGPTGLRRPPRRLLPLAVLAFAGLFAEASAADWSAVYIDGPLRASEAVAALGFTCFAVAMTVFRFAGDRLTDRLGPVAVVRAGGVAACGGLAFALAVGHPAAALAGFALMGAGLAALVPIVFRAAGTMAGISPGAGIAALSTVGYAAFMVGPPTIGLLSEAFGLDNALWLVVALLALLLPLAQTARPAPS
jgi:MFS family permease